MSSINVLIPSAGFASTDLINHLVHHAEVKYRLVLTDMNPNLGKLYPTLKCIVAPPTKSNEYLDFMLQVCKEEQIHAILPGKSADSHFLSENREAFIAIGVSIVLSKPEVVLATLDKATAIETLAKVGISTPASYEVTNQEEFIAALQKLNYPSQPVCIKPSKYPSESGRGFRILDPSINHHKRIFWEQPSELYYLSDKEILNAMAHEISFPPLLVMEYLPHEEYSVYCLCENGKPVYIIPNKRIALYQMSTLEAIIETNIEIVEYTKKILSVFDFDYMVNVQVKLDQNRKPKLVEINPRMAGTIMLPVKAGIDMIHWSIQKALGNPYPINKTYKEGFRIKREFISNYYDT
ncbi:MAG: ATP-grasp domain-containing protein [Bacteroidia bacterium]|jgi:carbamoyl-phosphate synthase large subunit|nr:ATP-grasp domain-containing protein [Bacteroidia bacterium]